MLSFDPKIILFLQHELLRCDYAVQLFSGVRRIAVYAGLGKCEEKRGVQVTGRRGGKEDVKGMGKEGKAK